MAFEWKDIAGFQSLQWGRYLIPSGIPSNTVCIRSGDCAVIYSPPTLSGLRIREFCKDFKRVVLIASNTFHTLGCKDWLATGEDCIEAYGADVQLNDFFKKGLDLKPISLLNMEGLGAIEVQTIPHCRIGEIWLLFQEQDTKALICCDAFFNYPRLPKSLLFRFLLKLGGSAPGLRISRIFRYLAIKNRNEYSTWLIDYLNQTTPDIIIPSHGQIIESKGENNVVQRIFNLTRTHFGNHKETRAQNDLSVLSRWPTP